MLKDCDLTKSIPLQLHKHSNYENVHSKFNSYVVIYNTYFELLLTAEIFTALHEPTGFSFSLQANCL